MEAFRTGVQPPPATDTSDTRDLPMVAQARKGFGGKPLPNRLTKKKPVSDAYEPSGASGPALGLIPLNS